MQRAATILNHFDGSRNRLDSLLESGSQLEILETGITISTFIFGNLVDYFPYIMNHVMYKTLFGKLELQESLIIGISSGNQAKIPKIPESHRRKLRVADPSITCHHIKHHTTDLCTLSDNCNR